MGNHDSGKSDGLHRGALRPAVDRIKPILTPQTSVAVRQ